MSNDMFMLWRVRRTLTEVLHARGFDVSELRDETVEDVSATYTKTPELLTICVPHSVTKNLSVVFFHVNFGGAVHKVGVEPVRDYIKVLLSKNISEAIIVVQQGLTPVAQREIEASTLHVNIFRMAELVVNVLNHHLVPKHTRLTPEETAQLLAKYSVKVSQLPHMYTCDKISRLLGLRANDVVRIERPNFVAGMHVTYRHVVKKMKGDK